MYCLGKSSVIGLPLANMRTHMREKPYECNHWEKTFSWQSGLTVYHRIHMGEIKVRVWQRFQL